MRLWLILSDHWFWGFQRSFSNLIHCHMTEQHPEKLDIKFTAFVFCWWNRSCNTELECYFIGSVNWSDSLLTSYLSHKAAAQITRFTGPTWGPPGSCRPQMGPMLAPWTLLSGCTTYIYYDIMKNQNVWLQHNFLFHWKLMRMYSMQYIFWLKHKLFKTNTDLQQSVKK